MANGRLPKSALSPIPGGFLEHNAARSWNAMYLHILQETGEKIQVNGADSSYRILSRQVFWRNHWCSLGKCGNAARPGTSNHGLGLAVDVPVRTRQLIDKYGARFGWAKRWSDAAHEPWHLKYRPGVWDGKLPTREIDLLTANERKIVRNLYRLRSNRGKVWNKAEKARVEELKDQIKKQREDIKKAAKKNGWDQGNRRQRYHILLKAYKAKSIQGA